MSKSVKASVVEAYGFRAKVNELYESRFEVVEGSNAVFDSNTLKQITKCVLRETSSKKYDKSKLTLLIEGKDRKGGWRIWVNLDSVSYKRYKDYVNCDIDPSKVCIYLLHDPEEEFGTPENDYSWKVCRIKKDAVTSKPQSEDDDEMLFGKGR